MIYKRDIVSKYQGSVFGLLWTLFTPLILILIYTYVFAIIFKFRWEGVPENKVIFGLVLYLGIIQYNFIAEVLSKAPSLIIGNTNYVKKVIFPTEILSVVDVAVALSNMIIAFCVWLLAYMIFVKIPSVTFLLLPILILPLIFFGLGLSWLFCSLTVYFRDIVQIMGFFVMALLFSTPIFYPKSAVPKKLQWIVEMNPLANSVEFSRDILIYDRYPNFLNYFYCLVISIVICLFGYYVFKKFKHGFPDAI